MAPVFNQAGIGFVSIGYRLAPTHVFPAGLDDCMNGLRWVYDNVDKLSGDPSRLFISGHSAGGHQTSLMAVRKDWQEDYGLPVDVVRGCLPVSGVFDFREGSGLSMRPRFLGPSGNEAAASPDLQYTGHATPVLPVLGQRGFPPPDHTGAEDGAGPARRRRRDRHPGTGKLRPPAGQPGLRRPGRTLGGQGDRVDQGALIRTAFSNPGANVPSPLEGDQSTQSSNDKPFIRLNSFVLWVTSIASSARAWQAIHKSFAPTGIPVSSR